MTLTYQDVYDGNERDELFTGDMRTVPPEDIDLRKWMTILTYYDEGNQRASVTADVVYLSNPQVQVTVRLMATVKGSNIGTAK